MFQIRRRARAWTRSAEERPVRRTFPQCLGVHCALLRVDLAKLRRQSSTERLTIQSQVMVDAQWRPRRIRKLSVNRVTAVPSQWRPRGMTMNWMRGSRASCPRRGVGDAWRQNSESLCRNAANEVTASLVSRSTTQATAVPLSRAARGALTAARSRCSLVRWPSMRMSWENQTINAYAGAGTPDSFD